MNILETHKKVESLSEEIEDIKKNQLEILELKNTTEIKKNLMWIWLCHRAESINLKGEHGSYPIWITEKTDWQERNRASGTSGTITRALTFVLLEWVWGLKSVELKCIQRNAWKFPKYSKRL